VLGKKLKKWQKEKLLSEKEQPEGLSERKKEDNS